MCGINPYEWHPYNPNLEAQQADYQAGAQQAEPRKYRVRYEASRAARVIVTGPCGETRVLTEDQAMDLYMALSTALKGLSAKDD
jgi:hypothetical protein